MTFRTAVHSQSSAVPCGGVLISAPTNAMHQRAHERDCAGESTAWARAMPRFATLYCGVSPQCPAGAGAPFCAEEEGGDGWGAREQGGRALRNAQTPHTQTPHTQTPHTQRQPAKRVLCMQTICATHACMNVCMYERMYVCLNVCMNVCMYECIYVCMYECMYV